MRSPSAPGTSGRDDHGPRSPAGESLARGRRDGNDRRHQRVLTTITNTTTAVREVSVAGIARAAGVHRSYLYRHPDLLDLIHHAATEQSPQPGPVDEVSKASLMADLAHARARAARAETTTRQLEARLSGLLGKQVWAETGLGPDHELAQAQRDLEATKHKLADTTSELDARTQELEAARATNRELMTQLNSPHHRE